MTVDKAWCNDVIVCIDGSIGFVAEPANRRDFAIVHTDVRTKSWSARTINNGAVLYDQIECHTYTSQRSV